jgi:hypothetical protein
VAAIVRRVRYLRNTDSLSVISVPSDTAPLKLRLSGTVPIPFLAHAIFATLHKRHRLTQALMGKIWIAMD